MWWMLVACGSGGSGTSTVPASEVKNLDLGAAEFLRGCWTAEASGEAPAKSTTECWNERTNHYNGTLTDSREGASPSLQMMRLGTRADEGLVLSVQMAGNPPGGGLPRATLLPIAGAGKDYLRFFSDRPGYPNEAVFQLKDGTLTSTYRGEVGGEALENAYVMKVDPEKSAIDQSLKQAVERTKQAGSP